MRDGYRHADEAVGRVLAEVDPGHTTIAVFCDHGFEPHWLRRGSESVSKTGKLAHANGLGYPVPSTPEELVHENAPGAQPVQVDTGATRYTAHGPLRRTLGIARFWLVHVAVLGAVWTGISTDAVLCCLVLYA
ncbi:MAG: hypothetical protein QGG40_07635, partial [Myxococcota bacterium]|nr:hypothetical protein [Myxococcota bacterium]